MSGPGRGHVRTACGARRHAGRAPSRRTFTEPFSRLAAPRAVHQAAQPRPGASGTGAGWASRSSAGSPAGLRRRTDDLVTQGHGIARSAVRHTARSGRGRLRDPSPPDLPARLDQRRRPSRPPSSVGSSVCVPGRDTESGRLLDFAAEGCTGYDRSACASAPVNAHLTTLALSARGTVRANENPAGTAGPGPGGRRGRRDAGRDSRSAVTRTGRCQSRKYGSTERATPPTSRGNPKRVWKKALSAVLLADNLKE